MNLYQLYSSNFPAYNKFGTPKEIHAHVQALGYEGETKLVDGYPLPSGKDFKVEESYIKRTSSVRASHSLWARIDEFVGDEGQPDLNNRIQVLEKGIKALEAIKAFGKIYASTQNGVEEFKDILACIARLPLYEDMGVEPVISREKAKLGMKV
ncbi:MAG: hypothetical protein AAFN10_08560 [Bacteroidota bacterium]